MSVVPENAASRGAVPQREGAWRPVLYRWFVEYNPLYFASAFCILGGVYLLARELPPDAFASKLGVVAATEVYQVLLIAASAILLRAGLKRSAAILGIVAFIFILDVACNGERLMSFMGLLNLGPGMRARRAIPSSLAFAALGPAKLWLLARVFRLRSAGSALAVTAAVVAALPLLPYAIELESASVSIREGAYLGLSWLGAPVLAWACSSRSRRWTSAWTEGNPDPWLTRRIAAAAPFLVSVLYAAHVLGWRSLSDLELVPAQASPYLLAVAGMAAAHLSGRSSRGAEFVAWAGAGGALWAAAGAPSSTGLWPVGAIAVAAGATLLALVELRGLRVFLPAAVCLFGGAYLLAAERSIAPPQPAVAWPAGLAGALLAGAVRQRDFRCLLVSALAGGAAVARLHPSPAFVAYGGMVSGVWLAAACWRVFPELRRWVPLAATGAALLMGAWMTAQGVAGVGVGYGLCAAGAVAAGVAFHRYDFQSVGLVAGAVLAGLKHAAWTPHSTGGWGLFLIAAGFVLLSAGVGINLLIARRRVRIIRF